MTSWNKIAVKSNIFGEIIYISSQTNSESHTELQEVMRTVKKENPH